MNKSLRHIICLLLIIAFVLMFSAAAFAAEQLWDKGRASGTFLSGHNWGVQMNVMSCSANKTVLSGSPYNVLQGVERVRAWGRKEGIDYVYNPATYLNTVNGAQLRLYCYDSRANYVYINGANPGDKTQDIPKHIWDIAGYIPLGAGSLLTTYANNLFSIGVTSTGMNGYDAIKTFKGTVPSAKGCLPASIAASNADAYTNGSEGCGQVVWFKYDFNHPQGSISALKLWPQSRIQYAVQNRSTLILSTHWTNYAGVQHTIN